MPSILDLPYEIRHEVSLLVARDDQTSNIDLFSLALSCKAFEEPALAALYRHLNIHDGSHCVVTLLYKLIKDPGLARKVQDITVHGTPQDSFSRLWQVPVDFLPLVRCRLLDLLRGNESRVNHSFSLIEEYSFRHDGQPQFLFTARKVLVMVLIMSCPKVLSLYWPQSHAGTGIDVTGAAPLEHLQKLEVGSMHLRKTFLWARAFMPALEDITLLGDGELPLRKILDVRSSERNVHYHTIRLSDKAFTPLIPAIALIKRCTNLVRFECRLDQANFREWERPTELQDLQNVLSLHKATLEHLHLSLAYETNLHGLEESDSPNATDINQFLSFRDFSNLQHLSISLGLLLGHLYMESSIEEWDLLQTLQGAYKRDLTWPVMDLTQPDPLPSPADELVSRLPGGLRHLSVGSHGMRQTSQFNGALVQLLKKKSSFAQLRHVTVLINRAWRLRPFFPLVHAPELRTAEQDGFILDFTNLSGGQLTNPDDVDSLRLFEKARASLIEPSEKEWEMSIPEFKEGLEQRVVQNPDGIYEEFVMPDVSS